MAQAPKVFPQIEAALKRLDDLAQRKPELAETVTFYRAVIPVLYQARQAVPAFTLDPDRAQQKLKMGQPLLVGEDLPLDGSATMALFLRLCQIIENTAVSPTPRATGWSLFKRGRPDAVQVMAQAVEGNGIALRATATRQIRQAVEQNQLDLAHIWGAIAMGDEISLAHAAAQLQLDASLLFVLVQNSLKPALQTWAQGVNQIVNLAYWRHGYCPMCGNAPALAEIKGKEGARHLRCTLCAASWSYPRLQCPFCNSRDHKVLGYLAVEDEEEKYRLQTCDACRNYLKVVVTYDPIPIDQLIVEDLATLHLDLVANERDFVRL